MNALTPNERREMSFRLKHSPALRGGTQRLNRVTLVQECARTQVNLQYRYFKLLELTCDIIEPQCAYS